MNKPTADKAKQRRGYVAIEAVNPDTGKLWNVLVSPKRAAFIIRVGGAFAYESALLVPAVLKEPMRIYEGIRRDTDESRESDACGKYCYLAFPGHGYDDSGQQRPDSRPFLVFVDEDRVAYNWRFDNDDLLPDSFEHRFREVRL